MRESFFFLNNLEIETNREIERRMRNGRSRRKRSICRYDRVILVKSDPSGRGSGGSTSGTRPFGQPLVLKSQESSPSTSTSLRPDADVAHRGANKKRWRCVTRRRNAFARVHQVYASTNSAIDLFSNAIQSREHCHRSRRFLFRSNIVDFIYLFARFVLNFLPFVRYSVQYKYIW